MSNLADNYKKEVVPALMKKFNYNIYNGTNKSYPSSSSK